MGFIVDAILVQITFEPWHVVRIVPILLSLVFVAQWLLLLFRGSKVTESDIPYGFEYLKYLPRWMSGSMYSRDALGLIEAARRKYPDSPFKLTRLDTDIVVLPESVVDELAGLPNEVASNILALQYDLVGRWTGLSMLQDVSLHLRVVQRRISPNMSQLTLDLEEEVTNAVKDLFPQNHGEWVELQLYHTMMEVAVRVFSRMVVGSQFCRDQRWLDFSMNFTENVFNSLIMIRYFPSWVHPILSYILPSVRNSITNIKQVEELLVPVFAERLKQDAKVKGKLSSYEEGYDTATTSPLDWFTEIARGNERDPVKMVHSQVLLALGAIHTSLFAEMNTLYDLISNPSYMQLIRDETTEVSKQGWNVGSYAKLHKLDSILRESQRMSPPFLTGLRRVMKEDHEFSNGIVVLKGQYVCVPAYSTQKNNLRTINAGTFDGLSSYHLKAKDDSWKSTQHQFATTDAFGHGRTACPGRFVASIALKLVFTKLINEYDFEFANGRTERPPNRFAHEIVFPDSSVKIKVRRRQNVYAPF